MHGGETRESVSGWTVDTYAAHNEALRKAELLFQNERDRRYTEVALEREKALAIKTEADKAALALAREIQTYKDEKANELRSQIERERGGYATHTELTAAVEKIEATIKPLVADVAISRGRGSGFERSWGIFIALGGLIALLLSGHLALR
jgi:aminopeptidase N